MKSNVALVERSISIGMAAYVGELVKTFTMLDMIPFCVETVDATSRSVIAATNLVDAAAIVAALRILT